MTGLAAAIAALPPLDRQAPFRSPRACKICGRQAIAFDSVDFNKYCAPENYYEFGAAGIAIDYFRCLFCGFIFTDNMDDWTHEEFARLIYNADYRQVDGEYVRERPQRMAEGFAARLRGCERARILDYGSGAGVFVDRMRELGFADIQGFDPFSSPLRPAGHFDIVTCFEVIEHSPDPVGTLADMKRFLFDDGCILCSQTVQPPDILAVRGSWWYLAPRNGHISTYADETLVELGRRHDLVIHRGDTLYGFAPLWPSSFSRLACAGIGPSFTTLRLLAPADPAGGAIAFPSRERILWHPEETDGIWRFRWTGSSPLWWEAQWGAVDSLQVRIAVHCAHPGVVEHCELELHGDRVPARLDRGELVADFAVAGATSGTIALHMPAPADRGAGRSGASKSAYGLAILTTQAPRWPAGANLPGTAAAA